MATPPLINPALTKISEELHAGTFMSYRCLAMDSFTVQVGRENENGFTFAFKAVSVNGNVTYELLDVQPPPGEVLMKTLPTEPMAVEALGKWVADAAITESETESDTSNTE